MLSALQMKYCTSMLFTACWLSHARASSASSPFSSEYTPQRPGCAAMSLAKPGQKAASLASAGAAARSGTASSAQRARSRISARAEGAS